MAYSANAAALRRCTGARKDNSPCRAWAVWDDPRQLCMAHAGRHHHGPLNFRRRPWRPEKPTMYEPCRCAAYQWPHRPGGGLCRWPDPPRYHCPVPAGTHGWPRLRRLSGFPLAKQRLSEARRLARAQPGGTLGGADQD